MTQAYANIDVVVASEGLDVPPGVLELAHVKPLGCKRDLPGWLTGRRESVHETTSQSSIGIV